MSEEDFKKYCAEKGIDFNSMRFQSPEEVLDEVMSEQDLNDFIAKYPPTVVGFETDEEKAEVDKFFNSLFPVK